MFLLAGGIFSILIIVIGRLSLKVCLMSVAIRFSDSFRSRLLFKSVTDVDVFMQYACRYGEELVAADCFDTFPHHTLDGSTIVELSDTEAHSLWKDATGSFFDGDCI